MADPCSRARGEEGSAIAELVIVAPILLIVIVLMVAFGQVDSRPGRRPNPPLAPVSRPRSCNPIPPTPRRRPSLRQRGPWPVRASPAPGPQISVDTSNSWPGGWVSVTVTCVTSLAACPSPVSPVPRP